MNSVGRTIAALWPRYAVGDRIAGVLLEEEATPSRISLDFANSLVNGLAVMLLRSDKAVASELL